MNSSKIQKIFYFLIAKKKLDNKEIVLTNFAKTLYYFCANYEIVYKNLFNEIFEEIHNSFSDFMDNKIKIYLFLEILTLFFYILFFLLVVIYLYYSNEIIIKAIIFSFLDFSEEVNNKNTNSNINNIIIMKLMAFKNIIDDFDMKRFKMYKDNINDLNYNIIMDTIGKDYNKKKILYLK